MYFILGFCSHAGFFILFFSLHWVLLFVPVTYKPPPTCWSWRHVYCESLSKDALSKRVQTLSVCTHLCDNVNMKRSFIAAVYAGRFCKTNTEARNSNNWTPKIHKNAQEEVYNMEHEIIIKKMGQQCCHCDFRSIWPITEAHIKAMKYAIILLSL